MRPAPVFLTDIISLLWLACNGQFTILQKMWFSLQQTVEDLTDFLLQNHLRPVPDTHDLRELCQLCASFQAGYLELEDDCDFLTQFATPSGFPSFERATQEDAEQALDTLQGILEFGQSQKQSQGPAMTM